jgi:hypothetical protein
MKKNILIIISAFILVSIFGCSGKNESNSKKHEEKEDLKKIEKELLKKLSAKLFDNCLSSPAFVETPYQEVPNASSKGGIFFDAETMVLNKQYSYYSTRTDVFNNHLSWKTELGKISNIKFKTTDYVKGKNIPMLEADWKSDDGYSIATFNIVPIMYQEENPENNGMLQYVLYTDKWNVMGNKSVSKEEFYDILKLLGKLSKTNVSDLKLDEGSTNESENPSNNSSRNIPGKYPEASKEKLNASELTKYNKSELRLIRNEIFARHGFIFKSPELISYFKSQNWYKPEFNDITDKLTPVEKTNIELLYKLEGKK